MDSSMPEYVCITAASVTAGLIIAVVLLSEKDVYVTNMVSCGNAVNWSMQNI